VDDARRDEVWDEIWALLEEGSTEDAISRALHVLNEEGDDPEVRYLLGVALLDADEPEAAIPELEQAAEEVPDWAEAHSALGWARFRAGRFPAATESADEALGCSTKLADAHELRGLLAERAGDDVRARRELAIARRLDPERYPKPVEMSEDEFLTVAQQAVADLDEEIREVLEETSFFVQPFPADELLRESDPPLDPQILGLFVGRSLLDRSVSESGTLPNTMYLFQRNLQRSAATREELEDEIRITVLHEIGHHLGWDEEELESRGLA
jgi:predicted Zn-dependent protease with MMP-like domain